MFDAFVYFVAGMAVDRFVLRPSVFKKIKIKLAAWIKTMIEEAEEDEKKEKDE
ncbi:MAG: hypothetical protein ACXADD_20055 [Candidatus Thorarchaeota archaeon]|jgi:hypothetical protein